MTRRTVGAALALVVLITAGCTDTPAEVRVDGSTPRSTTSEDERLAPGPFHLVDHEDVYLNGVENDDRPPISFLLIGGDTPTEWASEAEFVDAYVGAMRQDGWRLDPLTTDEDWWVLYGGRGSESVRVGPASRFTELATADEGYARPKFRRVIGEVDGPLVVVAIDPQD